ncbi:hypothetical protein O181_076533 [Austropuccinia psidii MF-1]|uniref:Expansin-like EG45 domain-containing protein n=1 Tax=Austropuccinia psidii MF-1 TaxID=1389203 RepID=A0A9Q3FF58_9BASI|nr:hypothetical protein [Austropuccinia psidii MF-1]
MKSLDSESPEKDQQKRNGGGLAFRACIHSRSILIKTNNSSIEQATLSSFYDEDDEMNLFYDDTLVTQRGKSTESQTMQIDLLIPLYRSEAPSGLVFFPLFSASPKVGTAYKNVQGTYWSTSAWVQNCLFQDWRAPPSLPPVAVARNLYLGAGYCGACVEIKAANSQAAPKRGIINTQCVDCPDNALDISPDLWNSVIPKNDNGVRPGKGSIDWKVVPCNFTNNMSLINKDGTSIYWFSMQAAGSNTPVKSLEVRTPNGSSWIATKREEHNYFTLVSGSTLNQSPTADISVTCTNGKSVVAKNVPLNGRRVFTISQNC